MSDERNKNDGRNGRPSDPTINILVVYAWRRYPLRTAVADHLWSFGRYAKARVFYLNVATRGVPRYLRRIRFDLVIFHTLLLSARWRPDFFRRLTRKAAPLGDLDAVKVALPQDEFFDTRSVEDFVHEFNVGHVFSVMPEEEWETIYPGLDREAVRLHRVLTGYLDEETLDRVRAFSAEQRVRPIDIGYRAWHAAPWLGRQGRLKVRVAEIFEECGRKAGLTTDISSDECDTIFGDDWYRFLSSCRFTVGAEGGASILDQDGAIRSRTEAYLERHPDASYEEVEAACFPGADGQHLVAISPRHLEACATRTCQILVEGDYSGILRRGEHYLSVKPDFSNVQEIVDCLRDESLRRRITERAYTDVVASGDYGYRGFVDHVLKCSLAGRAPEPAPRRAARRIAIAESRSRVAERLSWLLTRVAFGAWEVFSRRFPSLRARILRRG